MSIIRIRKRPIEHDAIVFLGNDSINEVLAFLGGAGQVSKFTTQDGNRIVELQIFTLEDGIRKECKHIASEGDIIVRGVTGEFWAVKPAVFEQSYDIIG